MSLLVVGSLHLDVVVRAPHLPDLDETVTGHDVAYVFGGKGGNQARAAARMGATVRLAARTGNDDFGTVLRDTLARSSIDLHLMQRDDGPSGMSSAIIDANGDYGAVIVSAANLNIDPSLIPIDADTRIVLLQNEIPEAVNLEIAQRAREQGAHVWLNAAPARASDPAVFDLVDLLIVNRVEDTFYTAAPCERLTTLGGDGVLFGGTRYPAYPVSVLSTHGAGDMFVGALAARVCAGHSIAAAIPFAQAAAALHVSSDAQGRDGLRTSDVRAFMDRHDSL